jgi:hypothetical protein
MKMKDGPIPQSNHYTQSIFLDLPIAGNPENFGNKHRRAFGALWVRHSLSEFDRQVQDLGRQKTVRIGHALGCRHGEFEYFPRDQLAKGDAKTGYRGFTDNACGRTKWRHGRHGVRQR